MQNIVEIPKHELKKFDELIKKYRDNYVRSSQVIVDKMLKENQKVLELIRNKQVSSAIQLLRELVWEEFLKDEVEFNAQFMKDINKFLETPKNILESLIGRLDLKKTSHLLENIRELCGEYAGRVFPYIYRLSLSNTQSRRSRSGKSFEAIIYKVYEELGYSYDSQSKVGRKTFDELGLGKKSGFYSSKYGSI